jgi:hypothetical protein
VSSSAGSWSFPEAVEAWTYLMSALRMDAGLLPSTWIRSLVSAGSSSDTIFHTMLNQVGVLMMKVLAMRSGKKSVTCRHSADKVPEGVEKLLLSILVMSSGKKLTCKHVMLMIAMKLEAKVLEKMMKVLKEE